MLVAARPSQSRDDKGGERGKDGVDSNVGVHKDRKRIREGSALLQKLNDGAKGEEKSRVQGVSEWIEVGLYSRAAGGGQ